MLNLKERIERRRQKLSQLAKKGQPLSLYIKLKDEEDFFNGFDTTHLEKRSLSPELESYLLDCLEERHEKGQVTINFSLAKSFPYSEEQVKQALIHHFTRTAEKHLHAHSKEKTKWSIDLTGGFLFLIICLLCSHFFHINSHVHPFMKVLSQSTGIIGWLVIWEPSSYFLYRRREDFKEAFAHVRLAAANIVSIREE